MYVANPGYIFGAAGVPRGAVISSANGKPTPNLAAFEAVVAGLADGERFTVRYSTVDDPNGSSVRSARMDRRWFPANHCLRDDAAGLWQCAALPNLGSAKPEVGGSTRFSKPDDPRAAALAPSLVGVGFDMPYSVSGITERNYRGTGLVVDAARGLVVVDRNTVPVSMGDVRVMFAGTLEIPGKVEFVHPLHNLAIVSYDPKLIGNTPVRSAKLLDRQDHAGRVAVGGRHGRRTASSTRAPRRWPSLSPIQLPLSRTMQFRESNLETIQLVNGPTDFDGVLTDTAGGVVGLWSSFAWESGRELQQENRGVAIGVVSDMLRRVQAKQPLFSLEAEFVPQPLAAARRLGLSDDWLRKLELASPNQRQVLSIVRLVGGSPAVGRLKQGDILLSIDDKVVTKFREVELAVADKPEVSVMVWRDGEETARHARHRGAERQRHRSHRHVGRRHAAGATPRDDRPARHSARGRVRGLFRLRLAGDALRAVPGPAHRRSRWHPHAESRRIPQGGLGPAGPFGHPPAHHHLEQRPGSDHAETRSALLADLRAQAHR